MNASRRFLLAAACAAILAAGWGCGGGGDDEGTASGESTGATQSALIQCPDIVTDGGTVTVRSSVECPTAQGLAREVLGRDDCVEKTPAGPNGCEARGFSCETTSEGKPPSATFKASCRSGQDTVEFEQGAG
jgi:hypothetical protein